MKGMKERVRSYIEEHGMISPGDTVVAGVSGGADSLCLFLLLQELTKEMDFDLHVVHVHHGLRLSARDDLYFVRDLCRRMQVPCTVFKVDAAARAKEWGTGVEEAGRRLRYEAFHQVCARLEGEKKRVRQGEIREDTQEKSQENTQKKSQRDTQEKSRENRQGEDQKDRHREKPLFRIAVAHHREDQAETVLFHLCRGTDLRGARGMLPVNGQIIRPLLDESRTDIEQYLTDRGFSWQEDETNADTGYTRNYIRREILPRLEEGVHAGAAQRISRFAAACTEAEAFLSAMTGRARERCAAACSPGDKILLPEGSVCMEVLRLDPLMQEDPYLQGRILYRCLADSTASGKDIAGVHVDALRSLCQGKTDGQLSMPSRVTVYRIGGKVFFCRERDGEKGPDPARESWADPASADLKDAKRPGAVNKSDVVRKPDVVRNPGAAEQPCPVEEKAYPLSEKAYFCRILDFQGCMSAIPGNEYTKWFDYDKIGTFPVFRTRLPGDRMHLFSEAGMSRDAGGPKGHGSGEGEPGAEGSRRLIGKKIARIMLDGKIPAGIRDSIVLPFCGNEALWIPGLRMGDAFRVTPSTARVLEIRWDLDAGENQDSSGTLPAAK